jgi:hypothetical protein
MSKYSSQDGWNEPGVLSKHLQFSGFGCFRGQPEYLPIFYKRMMVLSRGKKHEKG